MSRLAVVLCLAVGSTAQGPNIREATPAERDAISESVESLVSAANSRDAERAGAVTTGEFTAYGDRWFVHRGGNGQWTGPGAELARAQIGAMVRWIMMITDDVALAEGFFKTSNLKTDIAGDFSNTLLKRDGKWFVAAVRLAPLRFQPPNVMPVVPSPSGTAAGPDGWITLFDGKSTDAFSSMDGGPLPENWLIEGEVLRLAALSPGKRLRGQPGGIRTRDTYKSFELQFEWKMAPKGNSGVKYGLYYLRGGDGSGPEYQIVDDNGDPGSIKDPRQRSGALYFRHAPRKSVAAPLGEFNRGAIIVRGRHCEHWLNGEKVVEYEATSDPWESPIVLQNHRTDAWFRNIRIKRLE